MQSSSVVTFRALVMLGCLVAVPLAAVFGTSLPEVVSAILAGQWPGGANSPEGSIGDAPQFEPVMPGEMASMMPPRRMPSADPSAPVPMPSAPTSPVAWDASNGQTPAAPGVVAAGYEMPVGPGATANAAQQPPGGVAPVSVDRFTYIQDRLRQLGATYYCLETFEAREELYRFHCRIPVGGNPSYTRNYEALDSSPLGAMAKVLQQVETRSTVGL